MIFDRTDHMHLLEITKKELTMQKKERLKKLFLEKCSIKNDIPKIQWSTIREDSSDKITSSYAKGTVSISASNFSNAIFGLNRMRIGIASGHLPEYIGEMVPRFPLRPLWVGCDVKVFLNPLMESAIPSYAIDRSKLEKLCERTVELGYNAILFGRREGMSIVSGEAIQTDWKAICTCLHEYGLKIIVKASIIDQINEVHSPANKKFKKIVQNSIIEFRDAVQGIDFLFWESELLHPHYCQCKEADESTLKELVFMEMQSIEEALGNKTALIFYVPAPNLLTASIHSQWLSELTHEAAGKTIIAFSSFAGDPVHDHAPLHPFWDQLRTHMHSSSTALLPLVNIGGVKQGEGLWPSLSLDLLDAILNRTERHSFAGVISLVNFLPPPGGLLDCVLWITSEMLWRKRDAFLLAETWFSAYHPEWNFPAFAEDFKSIRQIAIHLSRLRSLNLELGRDAISSEEGKALSETLLATLKALEIKCGKIKKNSDAPSFYEYFMHFARDARRIILYFLQCLNISIPNVLNQEDLQESFWTQFSQSGGQGIRSGTVSFLDLPNQGNPGSRMSLIFAENRNS